MYPYFLNIEREKGGRKKNKHIVYAVYVQIYKYNFIRILMYDVYWAPNIDKIQHYNQDC